MITKGAALLVFKKSKKVQHLLSKKIHKNDHNHFQPAHDFKVNKEDKCLANEELQSIFHLRSYMILSKKYPKPWGGTKNQELLRD